MIQPADFFSALASNGLKFFTGVPDSLLKDLCAYITEHVPPRDHVINANEGSAVALAAGYHLATGDVAVVYLQNSGLGNAVNPLVSLAAADVYGIPMLLIVGWRGEPGVADEPQHMLQGRATPEMLDVIGLDYDIIGPETVDYRGVLASAVSSAIEQSCPRALLIRKDTFAHYANVPVSAARNAFSRAEAIESVLDSLSMDDVVVSTTGMTSREVFAYRERHAQPHARDFLTVGSMGHASQIARGIAGADASRQVFCLDGDGAMIMHLGSLAIIGGHPVPSLKHIVINNGAHDSVGGQPTAAQTMDLPAIALACGYLSAERVTSGDEIPGAIAKLRAQHGPAMLEIQVASMPRTDAGRPSSTPRENKSAFMRALGHDPH